MFILSLTAELCLSEQACHATQEPCPQQKTWPLDSPHTHTPLGEHLWLHMHHLDLHGCLGPPSSAFPPAESASQSQFIPNPSRRGLAAAGGKGRREGVKQTNQVPSLYPSHPRTIFLGSSITHRATGADRDLGPGARVPQPPTCSPHSPPYRKKEFWTFRRFFSSIAKSCSSRCCQNPHAAAPTFLSDGCQASSCYKLYWDGRVS